MALPPLDDDLRASLMQVSTATLTLQLLKRGLRNLFMTGVRPLNPGAARFVAEAYTLRNIPAREDLSRPEIQADPEYPQRKAIEAVPAGQALVMDCRGDLRAGMAGGILAMRLKVRGVAALVADGPMRDSAELAELDLPVFCAGAAAPASVAHHFAVDVQVPIACGGVPVFPGDVVAGDSDGVVVVPRHLVTEIAADAIEQERLERFVQRKIANGSSIVGVYPANEATRQEYQRWITAGEPDI